MVALVPLSYGCLCAFVCLCVCVCVDAFVRVLVRKCLFMGVSVCEHVRAGTCVFMGVWLNQTALLSLNTFKVKLVRLNSLRI